MYPVICAGLLVSYIGRPADPMDVGFALASNLPMAFVEYLHRTAEHNSLLSGCVDQPVLFARRL